MEISDIIEKVSARSLSYSSAMEEIFGWDDPAREVLAYTELADLAYETNDESSGHAVMSMIRITVGDKYDKGYL